jgi:hypothetical protein
MFSCADAVASLALRQAWSANLSVELIAFNDRETVHRRLFRNERDPAVKHNHARFDMLGPIGPQCTNLEHFGRGDGEKRACAISSSPGCRIISIGSNNQWDFERDIVEKTSCRVDTFDCTLAPDIRPPKDLSGRVQLHPYCVGATNMTIDDNADATRRAAKRQRGAHGPRVFLDWHSMLKSIGLDGPPTFLKMDVEGFEYGVLRSMMKHPSILPDQIALELHYQTQFPDISWFGRYLSAGEIATVAEELFKVGGYQVVDRHDNPYCKHCTEILLVRKPTCG